MNHGAAPEEAVWDLQPSNKDTCVALSCVSKQLCVRKFQVVDSVSCLGPAEPVQSASLPAAGRRAFFFFWAKQCEQTQIKSQMAAKETEVSLEESAESTRD